MNTTRSCSKGWISETLNIRFQIMRSILIPILIGFGFAQNSWGAGTVVAWGDNSQSQTNVTPGVTNVSAVAGGSFHSLALGPGSTITGWGDNSAGELNPPAGLTNISILAAGNNFSLALRSNGSFVTWGSLASLSGKPTNTVAIAASSDNVMALTADGTVASWGIPYSVPASATNVVVIAAGNTHSLALKGDGSVIAWGDSSLGKTMIPPGLTNVVALAGGKYHSLALRADGIVVGWGDNTYGQSVPPADLSNVVAIAAGALHSMALKGNGSVVVWGDNTYGQRNIPAGLSGVAAIAAGRYHNLAIIGNGAPVITVQPVVQYNPITGLANLRVMASGLQPLSYYWQQNGIDIPGANSSTLELTDLQIQDGGVYTVIVSNSVGAVTSVGTLLPPVWRRPVIVSQPVDQSTLCNEGATFTVAADGTKPLNYQWFFEGEPIENATNATLNMPHVLGDQAGSYSVVVSNQYTFATSQTATLTVIGEEPLISSPLTAIGKQGVTFNYTIVGQHTPTSFSASGLPAGLLVNTTNGVIQGIPLESGVFNVTLGTANLCAEATTNLTLTINSSIPVITSPLQASGTEQAPFTYKINASGSPKWFDAQILPQGLSINQSNGIISGSSLYAGIYNVTISASNVWGIGSANLKLTFTNAPISGLAIANLTTNYSSPYLLDFQFSLRDSEDPALGNAVVVDPRLLSATAFEDDVPVSPTETAVIVRSGSAKLLKAYLVLDFTESMASLDNGDSNNDGISDAIDAEVTSAQTFVNQQPADAQIGVYEFHREDVAPKQVSGLTTDKALLDGAISGIWTNYVKDFSAGSRCWDALAAAIGGLGAPNRDEQHYVIFVSDGRDESSTNTVANVIAAATNKNVQIYCIGFGAELDATTLQQITSETSGRYYSATNASDLAAEMGQIGKDLNGQYILRWATLKRSATPFMPSFQISYQGFTAFSPTNPDPVVSGTNFIVDTNAIPATTNIVLLYTTNYIISPYTPSKYAGDVTIGSLRLVTDTDVHPSGITLRATYIPRYIRQLNVHYLANWPCTVNLQSTNFGEMLYGWNLSLTNDGAGGSWAMLSSPNPQSPTNGIPFASFGKLLTFSFRDVINPSNAFSLFAVDNTIYTNTGNQKFNIENTNSFITVYPVLPYGTPVPWLIQHGFPNNFTNAELSDPDGDGALTWQEYQAATDPQSAASKFMIVSVTQTGPFGKYQITFSTKVNRMYRVEASSDLADWQSVQTNISGTGADVTVTDNRNPGGLAQSFYRVVVY